ncbi:ATP-binding protein [Enterobacter asburiae]|uniref:ATP-binding protein n=1 Tax=Enterobacter asburiae TaxID=61645 RepID=UPI001F47B08C|nr:ATP-binding protein [Enterobacter asburiae]
MGSKKTNVMVVGEAGAGKTTTLSQVTRIFLAKSDVSQIKALYSGENGERMAEAIRQNCNIRYPPKPGDEGQQK